MNMTATVPSKHLQPDVTVAVNANIDCQIKSELHQHSSKVCIRAPSSDLFFLKQRSTLRRKFSVVLRVLRVFGSFTGVFGDDQIEE